LGRLDRQGFAAGASRVKALTTAPILAQFDRNAAALAEQSAQLFVSGEAREGMRAFRENANRAGRFDPAVSLAIGAGRVEALERGWCASPNIFVFYGRFSRYS
jgi:hypothetical protein